MIDERGSVLVEKEKERAEYEKTFLFAAKTLANACSVLKAQISKELKKCLRMHGNTPK